MAYTGHSLTTLLEDLGTPGADSKASTVVACSLRHPVAARLPRLIPTPSCYRSDLPKVHGTPRTYSWQRMAWLGFDSVFDCATGGAPGLSELLHGYGDGFCRRIVANSTEFAAGALLHEDARYQGLYTGGYRRRLRHATVRAFQASVPGSHFRPAYSRFAAMAAGGSVPSLWSSHGISASDAVFGMGFGILDQMQNNYLAEFTPELKNSGRKVGRELQGFCAPRGANVSTRTLIPAARN